MEYLVESHLGGYYVSNSDSDIIEAYCEQCGDHDYIILSWEEGMMLDSLRKYFSSVRTTKEKIEEFKSSGLDKVEVIDYIIYYYQDDIDMISYLFNEKIISLNEKKELVKIVKEIKKNQISLVSEIYLKEKTKVLTKTV